MPQATLACLLPLFLALMRSASSASHRLSLNAHQTGSRPVNGPYTYFDSPECSSVGTFCEDIPTTNADLHVRRCTASEESDTGWYPRLTHMGSFVFQRPVPISEAGGDIFRIRMVGHEILLLDMHACNWSVVVAPYHVRIGGAYHVEIMHLYENFTYSARPTPRPHNEMHLAELLLQFFSRDEDRGCAWDDACPPCSDGEAPGRWIVRSPKALGKLSHCHTVPAVSKDGPSLCGQATQRLAVNRSAVPGMQWQPYQCKVRSSSEVDLQACVHGRKFCFVGDSHARHAMLGVTAELRQNNTWHEWEVSSTVDAMIQYMSMTQQTHVADFTAYYSDAFGWEPSYDLSSCSHVLMNFGQWPLSYVPNGTWSPSQYHLAVENAADFLLSLKPLGIKTYWLTTVSHNIIQGFTGVIDWRSDPAIAMYNQLSYSIMHERGIPVIDVFHLTSPLHDLAFDVNHYQGLVGHNLDLRIMNELCRMANEETEHVQAR